MHAIGPLTTHTGALIPRTWVRESTGMASSFRELETWTKLDKASIDTSRYWRTQVDAEQPNFDAVLAMFQGQSERHNPLQNPGLA